MYCPNCESKLQPQDHYCGDCGQKLALAEEFKLSSVLGQFFGNIFSLDSKVFKTLKVLFVPGLYYKNFVAGKRARYMHPLRLFIFLNIFLFGLLLSFDDESIKQQSKNGLFDSDFVWGSDTITTQTLQSNTPEEILAKYPQKEAMDAFLFKQFIHLYQDETSFIDAVKEKLPWLFFLLIPLISVCSFFIEWKKKALYLQHFLFWTNVVSAFILFNSLELFIYEILQQEQGVPIALALFCPVFSFWSLQKVFPTKGFFKKLFKWLLYFILGSFIIAGCLLAILAIGFFMF